MENEVIGIQPQTLYGAPPSSSETSYKSANIMIIILLLILGFITIINKKLTKKTKIIIGVILGIVGIIAMFIVNLIQNI